MISSRNNTQNVMVAKAGSDAIIAAAIAAVAAVLL